MAEVNDSIKYMYILDFKPLPGLAEEQTPGHRRVALVEILPSAALELAFDQSYLKNQ